MHASNCDHCGGFKRLIGEMYICTHCDPVILSTVSLRNKTVEHLPAGSTLELPLDFETSKCLVDQTGQVVGTVSLESMEKMKASEGTYSFLPIVYQNTNERFEVFFYPKRRKAILHTTTEGTQFERAKQLMKESLGKEEKINSQSRKNEIEKIANSRKHEADTILQENITEKEKVQKITLWASGICAGIAIQPIPFADIFILTPIQAVMAMKIGEAKGIKISQKAAAEIVIELGGVVGMGYMAQQTALQLLKFIPGGSLFTIPYVFATTYAMGKVCDYYYETKQNGESFSSGVAKKIFRNSLKEGKKRYEKEKN